MTFLELKQFTAGLVNDKLMGFHTSSDIGIYLNQSLLKVQRRLLKSHVGYYSTCVYTTTVVNQTQYSLPSDFLAMFDLWIVLSGTAPDQELNHLEPISLNQRHDYRSGSGTPTHFYLLKNSLNLVVAPDTAWTMEMIYAHMAPEMSADSDTPDCPDQYHELIGLLAARRCLTVDDRVTTLFDDEIKKYYDEITENEERVLNKPRYVIEVE
jgi:hypothetical protein